MTTAITVAPPTELVRLAVELVCALPPADGEELATRILSEVSPSFAEAYRLLAMAQARRERAAA